MSLLKAEGLDEADMTEAGKVFHLTKHDTFLAADEMGNSTVFVRRLYPVLLVTDWGIFPRNPDGPSPCKSLQKSHGFINRRRQAKVGRLINCRVDCHEELFGKCKAARGI